MTNSESESHHVYSDSSVKLNVNVIDFQTFLFLISMFHFYSFKFFSKTIWYYIYFYLSFGLLFELSF